MARSHHRKKHKAHLRQFRNSQEGLSESSPSSRSNATVIMSIAGAILGTAVSYFASNGSWPWVIGGFIVGTIGGYYVGKTMDKAA